MSGKTRLSLYLVQDGWMIPLSISTRPIHPDPHRQANSQKRRIGRHLSVARPLIIPYRRHHEPQALSSTVAAVRLRLPVQMNNQPNGNCWRARH
jgi:hypothetical protein